jgi:hypothetical protein
VSISANNDEVWLEEGFEDGFACLEQNFTTGSSSVTLEVAQLGDDCGLTIGIAPEYNFHGWTIDFVTFIDKETQLSVLARADGSNSLVNEDDEEEEAPLEFFF